MSSLPPSFKPIDQEEKKSGLPPSFRKPTKSPLRDVGEQLPKKGISSALGAYGDILDLIRAQGKENLLPGQEALARLEFEAPESLLPFLQEEDLIPSSRRIGSQRDIEALIEQLSGIGEPQTEAGRIVGRGAELAGGSLPFGASSNLMKILGALGGLGQLSREVGAPEAVATGIELSPLIGGAVSVAKGLKGKKVPVIKESGLPERKFEKLKKPTPVFKSTETAAKEAIENDFKNLTSDLLTKTNKSYAAITEDPSFRSKINNLFGEVQKEASNLKDTYDPKILRNELVKSRVETATRGLTPSESELTKRKELNRYIKDLREKKIDATTLLEQYRKNNQELSKIFPYGERALQSEGKKSALEAYNKAIAKTIDELYPNSEFKNLFNFTNKRWSEIKKIETVDKYLDALFGEKKINFKQAEKLLSDPKRSARLENALGKQSFENFKSLNKDLLSYKDSVALLKNKGVDLSDLSSTALAYTIKPSLAKLKFGTEFVKKIYRNALANPSYTKDWKAGIQSIKKGDVQKGLLLLEELAKKVNSPDQTKTTR